MKTYMEVEDLEVYRKLCQLHIEVCALSHKWPPEEKYELGSQIRFLEQHLPEKERKWRVCEDHADYVCPEPLNTEPLDSHDLP